MTGGSRMTAAYAGAILLAASVTAASTPALAADATIREPVARATGVPNRVGILIVGDNPAQLARAARASEDAEAIGKRLNELGFTTVTVSSVNRPDLDRQLREAAAKIGTGDDVAVFALGRFVSGSDEVWIVPGDAPPEIETQPSSLPTEALRLSDTLRRLSRAGPRTLSVIVDECAPIGTEVCAINPVARAASAAADVGIVATSRITAPPSDGRPLAWRPSGGDAILKSMTVEGADFLSFYEHLQKELIGGNLTVTPTLALSNTFTFWPSNLLDRMQIPCNGVDPTLTIEQVRAADTDALVQSCRKATQAWSFAETFKMKLALAIEQAAVKAIPRACADLLKARAFLTAYPASRWRGPIETQVSECAARDEAKHRAERQQAAIRVTSEIERLVQSNASAGELRAAGLAALAADAGSAAFRAFDEIDWRTDEEASWRMGQFYDPTIADKVLRSAVPRPDAARAGSYYSAWRERSQRQREALDKLCREQRDVQARDQRFREFCQ
ncbi:hypothetical protein [Methylorubrum extorquens]|uniref:Caspase family p20 domain-containing protein n=1 Tax=Methylorubrum extorquens (strain CM4 / NCIMB 13688) TaxID=440085 RepID=B7KVZ9_METC4|nr:hypothetical protein [Methylorubrum extorquens]ACK82815.1 hypothetical protein Mchl_1961 [Methylorubrum extorquens CM4]